jgi:hypothetical protein
MEDCGGVFQEYIDQVHSAFVTDFIYAAPKFRGLPVHVKRGLIDGKERGFWHLTQEGPIEENRTPDLRRCERIRWIRVMLENADQKNLLVWKNQRGSATRVLIWCQASEYLVVLEERNSAYVLWTAYPVTRDSYKNKLLKEFRNQSKCPTKS